jgi:hypothetical protein
MKSVHLAKDVLIQKHNEKLVLYSMTTDELFTLKGDVALMIQFIQLDSSKNTPVALPKIKSHLLAESETFRKNPAQDESIDRALEFFLSKGFVLDAT